eukprot:1427473-Amphidinium_carterae.1
MPLGKQRTNVWDHPLKPDLRSVNLGAHTTRGCGVTNQTAEWPEPAKMLHRVAEYRPKSMRLPYTSILLNMCNSIYFENPQRQPKFQAARICDYLWRGALLRDAITACRRVPMQTQSMAKEMWVRSALALRFA